MTRPHAAQARNLLADAFAAKGPAWRNTADSIRAANWGNALTDAALAAIEEALRVGPDEDE